MIDYLLKFNNKEVAETFAVTNGFAEIDADGAAAQLYHCSYSISVIGEHFVVSDDELNPRCVGDGCYWVLFRDLFDRALPEGAAAYVVWSSDMCVTTDGVTTMVDRPTQDPHIPNRFWA